MHVLPHRDQGHGPRSLRNGGQDASVLIDATLKENFPPISLPKREYMENAPKVIWEELGLPKLKPEAPWFGYSLGEWSQEFDATAARATAGDYFDNAESLEQRRRSDVGMNTEVRRVDERKPKAQPRRRKSRGVTHSIRSCPRKRQSRAACRQPSVLDSWVHAVAGTSGSLSFELRCLPCPGACSRRTAASTALVGRDNAVYRCTRSSWPLTLQFP